MTLQTGLRRHADGTHSDKRVLRRDQHNNPGCALARVLAMRSCHAIRMPSASCHATDHAMRSDYARMREPRWSTSDTL